MLIKMQARTGMNKLKLPDSIFMVPGKSFKLVSRLIAMNIKPPTIKTPPTIINNLPNCSVILFMKNLFNPNYIMGLINP